MAKLLLVACTCACAAALQPDVARSQLVCRSDAPRRAAAPPLLALRLRKPAEPVPSEAGWAAAGWIGGLALASEMLSVVNTMVAVVVLRRISGVGSMAELAEWIVAYFRSHGRMAYPIYACILISMQASSPVGVLRASARLSAPLPPWLARLLPSGSMALHFSVLAPRDTCTPLSCPLPFTAAATLLGAALHRAGRNDFRPTWRHHCRLKLAHFRRCPLLLHWSQTCVRQRLVS